MNKENQKEINDVFDLIEKQCIDKEFKELIKEVKVLVNENIEKQYKLDKIKEYIKNNSASLPMGRDEFTCEMRYSDPVVLAHKILELLEEIE